MEVAKILGEQLGRVGFVPKLLASSPKADLKQNNAESVDVMHARESVSCRSLRLRMPIHVGSRSRVLDLVAVSGRIIWPRIFKSEKVWVPSLRI